MSAERRHADRLTPEAEETLALVAHEIRAPLTVVSGYLELLERRPLDGASRARAFSEARKAVGRIGELLDDLAAATSPEALLAPTGLAPVSLAELAADTATVLGQAYGRSVEAVAIGSGTVAGDASRLARALGNLVVNALAYSPPDSAVTIAVSTGVDRVTVTVNDEGPGIPDEAREQVFERFERLDAAVPERPGMGLGLYIVRRIVEAHGGSVRAEAGDEGRGTRMVIELPAAPDRGDALSGPRERA